MSSVFFSFNPYVGLGNLKHRYRTFCPFSDFDVYGNMSAWMSQSRGFWLIMIICTCIFTFQYFSVGFIVSHSCPIVQEKTAGQTRRGQTDSFRKVITPTPSRTIYVITPTYPRHHQVAELTRLAQTLMHVPDMVWLVIEDANKTTKAVEDLLNRTGMKYVHLIAPMPEEFKNVTGTNRPRGVSNRNRGLQWLRNNATAGVFYFADDDNTYDIRIFEEMRDTLRISMWPVGLLSAGFSSPIIRDGNVVGFYEGWIGQRQFPVDMAGFAVSVEYLLQSPDAWMPFQAGYEEDGFLRSLSPFNISQIEYKASRCTEILVWHTQTKSPPTLKPLNYTLYAGTNLVDLYNSQI